MDLHIPVWLITVLFLVGGFGLIAWSFNSGSGSSSMGPYIALTPGKLVLGVICIAIALYRILH